MTQRLFHHFVNQDVPFATLFVLRNENDFQWMLDTIIPVLGSRGGFIGLATNGNNEYHWVDGTGLMFSLVLIN